VTLCISKYTPSYTRKTQKKKKLSLWETVETRKFVRRRGSRIFYTVDSQKAVRLSALCAGHPLPSGTFLVLISVRGWTDPRTIVRLEGLGQLKKSYNLIGNPATFNLNKHRPTFTVKVMYWNTKHGIPTEKQYFKSDSTRTISSCFGWIPLVTSIYLLNYRFISSFAVINKIKINVDPTYSLPNGHN
jgi:hypothetical protein